MLPAVGPVGPIFCLQNEFLIWQIRKGGRHILSAILHAGIDNILWLQEFQTPGSYALWTIFTNFGGTYYLYMVPALLWVVDYRLGLRVLLMLTATLIVNSILKEPVSYTHLTLPTICSV